MSTRNEHQMVPLAVLLKRELTNEKIENPDIIHGQANQSKKGEDFTLLKTECQRVPGDGSTTFSVFALFDGHNGSAAAIYSKENLLNNIVGAIPSDLSRDEWVAALPRALVAGFVKTDKDFQEKAQTSGTTCTFAIIDGWTVTVASVGDSYCILESAEGDIYSLSADHRLETNVEERERITASGGEVGRLNTGGGAEIGPLRCWPGGLCLSRSIGDMDVGEFIVPVPYVKQVKLSTAGGRLIISSDGVWDALPLEDAFNCCRGMPPEEAAAQVVKEAVQFKGLRDDTTTIVIDMSPPEKQTPPLPQPKKQGKGVFKAMFRKKTSESSSNEREYLEPDVVEELFEEGSANLSERYPNSSHQPKTTKRAMEEKGEGRSSTAKECQSPKHESATTTTTTTTAISSTSSSPSHEFSFTISLQPSSSSRLGKTKSSPSFAIDLSPADEIFFHGHLLPLHLLSHLPISPRSSTTSLECNLGTIPNKDSSEAHEPKENSNSNSTKRKSKVKSFSLLFRPAKWRKQCEIEENKEEVDEETSNKKVKFDASRILKRYLRMVRPFLFIKGKRKNCQMHRQQNHSFSSDTVLERKQERREGFTRRELSLSAPASMKTSRTNSDSSLATVKNITSSISDSNTMEDLQSAIEAAIAHCKNSVTTKEEKLLKR